MLWRREERVREKAEGCFCVELGVFVDFKSKSVEKSVDCKQSCSVLKSNHTTSTNVPVTLSEQDTPSLPIRGLSWAADSANQKADTGYNTPPMNRAARRKRHSHKPITRLTAKPANQEAEWKDSRRTHRCSASHSLSSLPFLASSSFS